MSRSFAYDVFLSYSAKDKTIVHQLAQQLKQDGLRVWLDAWEVRPGDNIPNKIEQGLESSAVLLLCMSANVFGSDWTALESQTFRFRDPLNKDRRFIPVRLDEAEPRGSLIQFDYIDWREEEKDGEYKRLVEACKSPALERARATAAQLSGASREVKVFSLGHTGAVRSVAWSGDGRRALSGSLDHTVRVWAVESGRCERVLEGHSDRVLSVAFRSGGSHALSAAVNGVWRSWRLMVMEPVSLADVQAGAQEVLYTNAKVLLVGDAGVGKTGLARYLALGIKDEERNSSTDGAWATQWSLPSHQAQNGIQREIWLWDFAGQVDYRLVHQLFMDDTAAAVLVFNPQSENPFDGLGQWDHDLQKATRKPFARLLAAGRIDRGGLTVSRASIVRFMEERGFAQSFYETSARTGEGCSKLREGIVSAIAWQNIPTTTSPILYHRMKQEVLELRDKGPVLIRLAELNQRMQMRLLEEAFKLEELETVVALLAGPGMIQRVGFGEFILLRPEILSRYAAAVVRQVRKHPQELGCIGEDEMLAGKLDYQDFERLPREQEEVVLRSLHETFISRAWCLRQVSDDKILLTFPSYFRRERPAQPGHPDILVTYRFTGPADDIYATLVVRLHYSGVFESHQLWRSAADFKTQTGQGLGLELAPESEGAYRLDIYFDADVDDNSRLLFARYVHNHLYEHAQNVVRLRHYACGNKRCKAYALPLADRSAIDEAIAADEIRVFCPRCGKPVLLRDVMEKKFESSKVKKETREIQAAAQEVLDNESRELILVGHAYSIVAEAGQIYRGYTNSDHGIDGEIEFKNDQGHATGKRLYLQLKSGDSYLTRRQRDDAEIFHIKKPRWADYWQAQAYPVMLVIRGSRGEIRWMDVTAYLKSAGDKVKQVVFAGERFDVMSVRRWRDKVLSQIPQG
ncbi:MAG TPA: TIR domain-containing protein [Candidatus Angelobacter sp.]